MAAEQVVLLAVVEPRSQRAGSGRAHRSMVLEDPLVERVGDPAFHARGRHRYPVDPSPSYRCVSADFLEASTSEQLHLAVHVMDADVAVAKRMKAAFDVVRSGNAKLIDV